MKVCGNKSLKLLGIKAGLYRAVGDRRLFVELRDAIRFGRMSEFNVAQLEGKLVVIEDCEINLNRG